MPYAGSGTWANRPAVVPASGTQYFATDIGENGSVWQSNGTRWRALNGEAVLKFLTTSVAGIAAVETIILQSLIPAGVLQAGDLILVDNLAVTKSGSTDSTQLTVRVGTLGTVAGDTVLTGLSAYTLQGATTIGGGYTFLVRNVSTTSMQKMGNAATGAHSMFAGSTTAVAAATAGLADNSSNAVYFSVALKSSSTNDTISGLSCTIRIVTP